MGAHYRHTTPEMAARIVTARRWLDALRVAGTLPPWAGRWSFGCRKQDPGLPVSPGPDHAAPRSPPATAISTTDREQAIPNRA
jgi:hypothetical protein